MALKPPASVPARTCISSCMGLCARLSETRRVRACVRDFDHSSHGCPPPPNETPRENKMTARGLSASLSPSRRHCPRPVIYPNSVISITLPLSLSLCLAFVLRPGGGNGGETWREKTSILRASSPTSWSDFTLAQIV